MVPPPKEKSQERRRAPRIPAELPIFVDSSSGRQKARVRDLSSKGICFFMDDPLPEMTAVKIDLEIPYQGTTEKVSGDGAVVRCRRIATGLEHFEVAVFFTFLGENGKRILDRYVETARSKV